MEISALVPFCGNAKKHGRRQTYDRLKSFDELSDNAENIALLQGRRPIVQIVGVIAKVKPNISRTCRLSAINVLKRFRDAYIDTMFDFAKHAAPMNNIGEIHFSNKIRDDFHRSFV